MRGPVQRLRALVQENSAMSLGVLYSMVEVVSEAVLAHRLRRRGRQEGATRE